MWWAAQSDFETMAIRFEDPRVCLQLAWIAAAVVRLCTFSHPLVRVLVLVGFASCLNYIDVSRRQTCFGFRLLGVSQVLEATSIHLAIRLFFKLL